VRARCERAATQDSKGMKRGAVDGVDRNAAILTRRASEEMPQVVIQSSLARRVGVLALTAFRRVTINAAVDSSEITQTAHTSHTAHILQNMQFHCFWSATPVICPRSPVSPGRMGFRGPEMQRAVSTQNPRRAEMAGSRLDIGVCKRNCSSTLGKKLVKRGWG
jgi:hypothetical protein